LFLPNEILILNANAMWIMIAAAIGWGVYSFLGKNAKNPLLETTQNLVWATPIVGFFFVFWHDGISFSGFILAIISGAITSGLGYIIWYSVLPSLKTSLAAILQLSVPIIAALAGVIFFSEAMTLELILAIILVIIGTFVSLIQVREK
jgi:drug/metabolite transporter (DMT)-like permease